ncbi:Electron-transferring-flavoprotein dehydrogenase [mine drainage metagenome]|uniref:Electron-transferring-flavoprotein dehydrogenase n=1 Tax=mine drainage metagenome TaxID=410659 RepID=T0YIB4_9ZZZZ
MKPLLAGSEMKEYTAHLIPEAVIRLSPKLYGDGWMMVGDAAMFVNAVHREGSNLAMTSGRLAAETVIELIKQNKEMTEANLSLYREKLDDSFVLKDLKKYKDMPGILHKNHQFFTTYPELVNRAAHSMLTVDGVDKKTKELEIRRSFLNKRSLFGLIGDAFKMWRAFE